MKIIEDIGFAVRRFFTRRKVDAQRHAILEKLKPLVAEHGALCVAMKGKTVAACTHLKYGSHTNLSAILDVLDQEHNALEQKASGVYSQIDELFKQLDKLED